MMEGGVLSASGFLKIGLNFHPNILAHRVHSIPNKNEFYKRKSNKKSKKEGDRI